MKNAVRPTTGKEAHPTLIICFKYVSDKADENAGDKWKENINKGCLAFVEKIKSPIFVFPRELKKNMKSLIISLNQMELI